MVVLGIVVLALLAVVVVVVLTGGGAAVGVGVFGVSVSSTAAGLFLAGLAVGVLALLGVLLVLAGLRRSARRRREVRGLRRDAGLAQRRAEPGGGATEWTGRSDGDSPGSRTYGP